MMKLRKKSAISDFEDVREKSMFPLAHRIKSVFALPINIYYSIEIDISNRNFTRNNSFKESQVIISNDTSDR